MRLAQSAALALGLFACGLSISTEARGQAAKAAFEDKSLEAIVASIGELKGKVVLFSMFASWDGHSQKHFELLEQLAARYKDHQKHFALVTVSLDTNPQQLQQFLGSRRGKVEVVRMSEIAGEENPFAAADIHFGNRVPYVAIFDQEGTRAVEWDGLQPVTVPVGYIDGLLKAGFSKDKADPKPKLLPPPKSSKSTMLTLKLPSGETPEPIPNWLPYAIGAVVMGVILLIGLIVHLRS